VHPTISAPLTGIAFATYPIATITGLLNPSYPVDSGTAKITMSVYGTNFFPKSMVYINGVPHSTTYQTDTFLTVTFSPSQVNAVGEIPVTVVNPKPGGGASAPYSLIGYRSIPLTASALTVDPVGGLLYAAIPSSNTVIPIDPATGALKTPIKVDKNPQQLAVSSDGSELYVAASGVLQRISLKTLEIEKTFKLPVDSEWGQTYVREMHVVPGSPKLIVVELFANVDPPEDGAALYNDSGLVNWIRGEAGSSNPLQIDSFTFTTASSIFAIPGGSKFFTEVQVSPTGISGSGGGFGGLSEQTGSIVRSDGMLLYTNTGQVWNPTTQKLLGTYLGANSASLFDPPSVLPDNANGHTYFLDSEGPSIDVYDQTSYALQGTVPFPGIYGPDVADLVRWGKNGFAFRSVDTTGFEPSENQIVIVTSPLVTANNGAPIPILTAVTPSTVKAGGTAF
jgi:hypothetical protein